MQRHAAPARHIADHLVAGDRQAAAGAAELHVLGVQPARLDLQFAVVGALAADMQLVGGRRGGLRRLRTVSGAMVPCPI